MQYCSLCLPAAVIHKRSSDVEKIIQALLAWRTSSLQGVQLTSFPQERSALFAHVGGFAAYDLRFLPLPVTCRLSAKTPLVLSTYFSSLIQDVAVLLLLIQVKEDLHLRADSYRTSQMFLALSWEEQAIPGSGLHA
jgi:hypothetical protein